MDEDFRKEFQLESDITFLNCANMSPMLTSVRQAGLAALELRSSPWNISSDAWFEQVEILRTCVANLFNADADDISLIPSASYGLAVAAKNLRISKGKKILVLEDQYPSNYYVWEDLATKLGLEITIVARQKNKSLTECLLEQIRDDVGLVSIPNNHWMDGSPIDLSMIREATKQAGSFFVLDLSQSLGVVPIDIRKIDPDFAVSVGYKWQLGPYGLGYLYVSERFHHQGEPLEYSWLNRKGSEDFTKLTKYTSEFKKGARRFDMGGSAQFNLIGMSIEALRQILKWGVSQINEKIIPLNQIILDYKIQNGLEPSNTTAGHIISISLNGLDQSKIKERLTYEKVIVSFRGDSIRISPHLYNNPDDIHRFLNCLK